MRNSNYDKFPVVTVPNNDGACVAGWEAIGRRLREAIARRAARKTVLVVECYPGVDEASVLAALTRELRPTLALRSADALKAEHEIDRLCEPFLGGDDPVFGYLSNLTLPQFFSLDRITASALQVGAVEQGVVLVVGVGARLIADGDLLVYADLARWEIQQRQRRGEIGNLGANNASQSAGLKYTRVLHRLARGRSLEETAASPVRLLPRYKRPTGAEVGRRRCGPSRARRSSAPTVSRGAVLRSRAVGRPMDEGGLRP